MKALFWKELGYYLKNPIGYIIITLFAVFANFLFVKDLFAIGNASMRAFFDLLPWLMIIFVPAISMRSLSEEKRANTLETLLTLPVSEVQIVLAKYFALLVLVAIALLLTISLPVSLAVVSTLYLPEVIMGYLGVMSVASVFISISMFFSSLTKNQVVAFLSSALSLFFLLVLNGDFASGLLPRSILDVITALSPYYYYQTFVKGLLDIRALFYFCSLTLLFLGLTVIDLEKRG